MCKYYQVFGGGRKRKILLLKERSKKWKPHQELLKTMFKLPNLWVLKVFLLLRKFCTKYLNTKSKRTLQELWIFSNLTLMPGHNCCRLFMKCNFFIIVTVFNFCSDSNWPLLQLLRGVFKLLKLFILDPIMSCALPKEKITFSASKKYLFREMFLRKNRRIFTCEGQCGGSYNELALVRRQKGKSVSSTLISFSLPSSSSSSS